METPDQYVFIISFKQISHIVLVSNLIVDSEHGEFFLLMIF